MSALKIYDGLATGLQPNTRIEANPGPLGLEDDLFDFSINHHSKPLIKVTDMLAIERELRKGEDAVAEVSKVLTRRIAHHMTRYIKKHTNPDMQVYGERYPTHESRALEIADDLALETRLFPSLVLLHQQTITRRGEERKEPRAVLRLDTLLGYKVDHADKNSIDVHVTAKSGELDNDRADRIALGMLYLSKLLPGKHELILFSANDAAPNLDYLKGLLGKQNMTLGTYKLNESREDIRQAAIYAIERYSEREAIVIPRRKLRLVSSM